MLINVSSDMGRLKQDKHNPAALINVQLIQCIFLPLISDMAIVQTNLDEVVGWIFCQAIHYWTTIGVVIIDGLIKES